MRRDGLLFTASTMTVVWATRVGLAFSALVLAFPAEAAAPHPLSLAQAVARARGNPLVRAAQERTRSAQAQVDEVRGARWPHAEITSFIAPSPKIKCDNSPDCTRTDPQDVALRFEGLFGGVKIELFQPLYTFGKIDSGVDAASSAERANEALASGVTYDLELDTARAYYGVDLARELAVMLGGGSDQVEHAVHEINERLERGESEVTVQDRLRLATFGAEIRARASEAREAEATARYGLRALVGDNDADTLAAPLDAMTFEPGDVAAYVERALRTRPELTAAREGVHALESLVSLERARFFPDLGLFGVANVAAASGVAHPPSAFANDPFNTSSAEAALVLRWTLDPVSQAARTARASAELERGKALQSAAERATNFAVLQAYTRVSEAKKRLEAAREGEKNARGWVASVLQADAIGTATARDIADAYLAYFTLHGRLLQSIYDFNVAIFSLRRAFGDSPIPPEKP